MTMRMIYEAYSVARAVEVTCGPTPSLREALERLEEFLNYPGEREELDAVAELLQYAAEEARVGGCLEWYLLLQAADTLAHSF